MVRKCCVPGCRTGYESDRKQRKNEEKKKLSFFSVPRDDFLQKKWTIAIRRKDKILTHSDLVCELHFAENFVSRVYETIMPDGSISVIERERPKLKKDAIPTIFSFSPKNTSTKYASRKVPIHRMKKNKNVHLHSQNIIPLHENIDLNIQRKYLKEHFSFDKLAKNLDKVQMPSSQWIATISPCNNFITCTDLDKNKFERKVVVSQDLVSKVYINNIHISLGDGEIIDYESFSSLLHTVDKKMYYC